MDYYHYVMAYITPSSTTIAGFCANFVVYVYQTFVAIQLVKRSKDIGFVSAAAKYFVFVHRNIPLLLWLPVASVAGRRVKAARYAVELDILVSEQSELETSDKLASPKGEAKTREILQQKKVME